MKHGKYVGNPAPSGKGGLKTLGETSSTKKLLSHAGNAKKADSFGKKK